MNRFALLQSKLKRRWVVNNRARNFPLVSMKVKAQSVISKLRKSLHLDVNALLNSRTRLLLKNLLNKLRRNRRVLKDGSTRNNLVRLKGKYLQTLSMVMYQQKARAGLNRLQLNSLHNKQPLLVKIQNLKKPLRLLLIKIFNNSQWVR